MMADALKAAFAGFQHVHMFDIHAQLKKRKDVMIVAACEEDLQTRKRLAADGKIHVTHERFGEMLETVDFDFIVVGEVFARRGALIRAALKAGKHVLSDKPICTDLRDLARIEILAERHSLAVGAALELRDSGAFLLTRELVQSGLIGELRTINFSGQHPLLLASRPGWYFQGGNHGGTINDIAIHAVDILQRITGAGFSEVSAARSWNAGLSAHPRFRNAAQVMLVLDGGCGVMGDLSYISPGGFRYSLPQYWRFNFWGDRGMIECGLNLPRVRLYRSESETVEELEPPPNRTGGYVDDFLLAIRKGGSSANAALFSATEVCLKVQAASDRGLFGIPLKD
jgi:predicted dehydrogenase